MDLKLLQKSHFCQLIVSEWETYGLSFHQNTHDKKKKTQVKIFGKILSVFCQFQKLENNLSDF